MVLAHFLKQCKQFDISGVFFPSVDYSGHLGVRHRVQQQPETTNEHLFIFNKCGEGDSVKRVDGARIKRAALWTVTPNRDQTSPPEGRGFLSSHSTERRGGKGKVTHQYS